VIILLALITAFSLAPTTLDRAPVVWLALLPAAAAFSAGHG
jgi:hypothetical protein